ncbi:MAG TPA: hypothetical protein VE988_23455 [Gemmataceae bacterium]|nr:hypothetical protein [Gemmataceae bacterium]
MLPKSLLAPILTNDSLTRGLGDAEARMLVEYLVEEAEQRPGAERDIPRLCRWARGIARFVQLWSYQQDYGAATQLAGAEGFQWTLPATWMEACELMEHILASQATPLAV